MDYTNLINALNSDVQSYASTNPWYSSGTALMQAPIQYTEGMNPWEYAAAQIGQGFIGGLARGYGAGQIRDYQQGLNRDFAAALRQPNPVAALNKDPRLVNTAAAFQQAQMVRGLEQADALQDNLLDPKTPQARLAAAQMMQRGMSQGMGQMQIAPQPTTSATGSPGRTPYAIGEVAPVVGDTGALSMAQQQALATQQAIASGLGDSQANEVGKTAVAAQRQATDEAQQYIADLRKKAEDAKIIGQNTLLWSDKAGETGTFPWLRNTLAELGTVVGNTDQREKLAATQMLDRMKPRIVSAERPPGSGATSDTEFMAFVGAGASSGQLPEVNKLIGQWNLEVGNFKEAEASFKERAMLQGLSIQQANQQWEALTGEFSFAGRDNAGNYKINSLDDFLRAKQQPQRQAVAAISAQALIPAVIQAESGGNPNAVSPAGAQGLMQLMPGTGREMHKELGLPGEYNPFDPEQNKQLGTAYLAKMQRTFKSVPLALAAYNAGPGRVMQAIEQVGSTDPAAVLSVLPEETQQYVPKVLKLAQENRAKMMQAPEQQQAAPAAQPSPDGELSGSEQFLKSAASGLNRIGNTLTLGAWDEGMAGLAAAGNAAVNAVTGREGPEMGQLYDHYLAKQRRWDKEYQQENPIAATALDIGSGFVAAPTVVGGMLKPGAGALSNVLRGAATGGALSGIYGFNQGEGGAQNRWNNATEAAAIGAPIGAVATPLLSALAGSKTAQRVIAPAAQKLGQRVESSRLGKVLADQAGMLKGRPNINPGVKLSKGELKLDKALRDVSDADFAAAAGDLTSLQQAGKPATLVDVFTKQRGGGQLLADADYIANVGRGGNQYAQKVLSTRADDYAERVTRDIGEVLGFKSPSAAGKKAREVAQKAVADVEAAGRKRVKPIYDSLKGKKLNSRVLRESMQNDAVQEAMAAVRKEQPRKFGKRPDGDFEFLDEVKKKLYDMEDSVSGITGAQRNTAQRYRQARQELVEAMDWTLQNNKSYGEARMKAAAYLRKSHDMKDGPLGIFHDLKTKNAGAAADRFMKLDQDEIATLKKYAGDDLDAVISELIGAKLTKTVDNSSTNNIKQLLKPGMVKRYKWALGEEKAAKLIKRLEAEKTLQQGNLAMGQNSKTAIRQQTGRELDADLANLPTSKLDLVRALTSKFYKKEPSEELAQELAELIFGPDGKKTIDRLGAWRGARKEWQNRAARAPQGAAVVTGQSIGKE